ncbi:MAG: SprB repeat-containing protein, partial [Bacteroidota bacterium]
MQPLVILHLFYAHIKTLFQKPHFLRAGLLIALIFCTGFANAQLIINELSQGFGDSEYVELVVTGNVDCGNDCVDISGWILDDNNGWYGTGNISLGAIRFNNDPQWQCIKIGSIIVIYNEAAPNIDMIADDETDANGDCVYVLPGNSSLLDRDSNPGAFTGDYSTITWTSGGEWDPSTAAFAIMNNGGDAFHLVNPADLTQPHHSLAWGSNNTGPFDIYFAGTAMTMVFTFDNTNDDDPYLQSNWSTINAFGNQSPGVGNTTENTAWIDELTIGCSSLSSISINSIVQTCDWVNGNYTVTFNINNGDPSSYFVTGTAGTVVGNQFTSDPIPIGTGYTFGIDDDFSCGPITIFGQGCVASPCDQLVGCYGPNLITDGHFEAFDPLSPFANLTTDYGYNGNCTPGFNGCNLGVDMCQGDFAIGTSASDCNPTWSSNLADHTLSTGAGNMMMVDFDQSASENIWCQTVTLTPNTLFCFGGFFINPLIAGTGAPEPVIRFEAAGSQLGLPRTIPEDELWHFEGVLFNSGLGGNFDLCIVNDNFGGIGYDLALDDISIRRVLGGNPPTPNDDSGFICAGESSITIDVDDNDLPSANGLDVTSLNVVTPPPFSAGVITNIDNTFGTITFAPEPGFTAVTFEYQICDFNDCCETATVTISEVPGVNLTTTVLNDLDCNGDFNGSAIVNPSSGLAPFTYLWDNAETGQNAVGLTGGIHIVSVTDANMCMATTTVEIMEPPLLTTASSTVNDVTCNGDADGQASTTPSGGTTPYTYIWNNGFTTQTISNLSGGTYQVTVTDDNGCTTTSSVVINEPSNLTASALQVNQTTCNGFSDGEALASGSGGTPGYTFLWSDGQTNDSATGLSAGSYTVTITDSNMCSDITSVIISEPPPIPAAITGNLIICEGESTTLTASGGDIYNWSNGDFGPVITVSPTMDMTYTVTVSESANLIVNGDFEAGNTGFTSAYNLGNGGAFGLLSDPADYGIFSSPNLGHNNFASCGDNTPGGVNMFVANGATVSGTAAWCQTVSVSPNTTYTFGAFVNGVDLVSPLNQVVFEVTANGVPFGGTFEAPPYHCGNGPWIEYSANWNSGAATSVTLCINTLTSSGAGFDFALDDITFIAPSACSETATVTVTVNDAPEVDPMSDIDICIGETANLSATATGGDGNYSFEWDNGLGSGANHMVSPSSTTTYSVTVTDGNMCSGTGQVTVNVFEFPDINPVVTDITCNGDNDGSINLTETTGNACLSYNWTGPNTFTSVDEDISGLEPGNYSVTVSGCNNCSITASFTITEPSALTATINLDSEPSCNGDSDGQATVTAMGGTLPYTYLWDNGEMNPTASILSAGSHSVTVTDNNNCSVIATLNMTQPNVLFGLLSINNDVLCNGEADGSATITPTGGTSPYTFLWDNGETDATALSLNVGSHTVTLTDANMCTFSGSVNLTEPPALNGLATVSANISCFGASDGVAAAIGLSGTPPYTYVWDNGVTGAVTGGLDAGNHEVTIFDANMCQIIASVNIIEPGPFTASVPDASVSCAGDTDGALTLTINGGTMPFTFDWDNAPDVQNPTGLSAGIYTVTVTDDNMCSVTASATISEPGAFSVTTMLVQDATCGGIADGSATATPSGGTMPYTFTWDNGETNATATNLDGGTNVVTVTDASMCSTTADIMIAEPNSIMVMVAPQNLQCNGDSDGEIDLIVSGGTMPYTFAWDNGLAPVEDQINLSAGMYRVTVSDNNGCSVETQAQVMEPTALLATTMEVSGASCTGESDGSAEIILSGGTPGYEILWDNGETTDIAIALSGGQHQVTVTDLNLCQTVSNVMITEPTALTAGVIVNNTVSCNGGSNGSATIFPSGGTPAYTFLWDNGETDATAVNLTAGTHAFTVTDVNDCPNFGSVVLTEPPAMIVSTSLNSGVSCNGDSNGSASIGIVGGTPAYTFLWDNGETTSVATALGGGIHLVTVTDANGCLETSSILIPEPPSIGLSLAIINDVSCNGGSDGSASATPSGGSPAYTFLWDNGETNSIASNLVAGSHTITLTDANGCEMTSSINISESSLLSAVANVTSDISCNGENDGVAVSAAIGGTPPYTYLWDNGDTTPSATGLMPGIQQVTVTDAGMCVAIANVNIVEPALVTVAVNLVSDVSCNSFSDGSATAAPSGGTPGYTFQWDNGETDAAAISLNAGLHIVSVTDANMCQTTASIMISEPMALTAITVLGNNVSCAGADDGSATASGIGGTMPYTYTWDNGETDATATNLSGGIHTVTVTDVNTCLVTATIDILEPTMLSLGVNLVNDVSCNGDTDGSASANVSGGTSPYTFLWSNGETDAIAINLTGGTQSVTVTDNNNCSITGMVSIAEPSLLSVSTVVNGDVNCNGDSDGSASATASGGTPAYTYLWSNGITDATANNLTAGTHFITITDANSCEVTASVTIIEPSMLSSVVVLANGVSCSGAADGSAVVSGNGGTPAYTYLWDNGETTSTATNLTGGNHVVTTTDANGCTFVNTINIPESLQLNASATSQNDVNCNGFSDGSALASGSGGTIPYTFDWDNGETNALAISLNAGMHVVTVSDANGCFATASVTINEPTILSSAASSLADVQCFGEANGSAAASGIGGTPPYTFEWDNGETDAIAIGLDVGTHIVTITDNNGCEITASAVISEPTQLSGFTVLVNDITCNGADDGSATASGVGGTPPYAYLWDTGTTGATVNGLGLGVHIVTITDSNMCTVTTDITINEPSPLMLTASLINDVSCNGFNDGSAEAIPSGGTMPYTFSWDNGETTSTAVSLDGSNHLVTLTDANGCTETASVIVSEPPQLQVSTSVNNDVSCNGANDGSASALPSGGTAPYTFLWDNGETTAIATNLTGGVNGVTITDANGCTANGSETINEPAILTGIVALNNHISCFGLSDGAATAIPNGGTPAYTYAWDNGETDATAVALSPGLHIVTISDLNGCTTTGSINITEPLQITASTSLQNDVSCASGSDGSASVAANGGTIPYTYLWDNGETTLVATGLTSGLHIVTVTDANSCSETASLSVSEPTSVSVSVDGSTSANCTSCDGTADITPSGGTPPYTYTWSNGNTLEDPFDLCSGVNFVTVTDMNGCISTTSVTVGNTSTLVIDNTTIDTEISCNGDTNGSVSVTVSGGQVPYTYIWTNGSTTSSTSNLGAGNVTVTVTDGDGCVAVGNVTLTEPDLLLATAAETQQVLCAGSATGEANVIVSGGAMPYTYQWSNGATDDSSTGLSSGPVSLTVTDTNGCSTIASTTISEVDGISASLIEDSGVLCFGDTNGQATASAMGGTVPYTYLWENGETDASAINLSGGLNSVTVTDTNGCFTTGSVIISEPMELNGSAIEDQPVLCAGEFNGQSTATFTGGTMPYTYNWDNGETNQTALNLGVGTHVLTITDNNGCTATAAVDISEPAAISFVVDATTDANCTSCDGSASISIGGGTAPFTYQWPNGNTNEDPSDLCSGGNVVTVTDANGCSLTSDVVIGNISTLVIDILAVDSDVSCNGFSNGQASVTVSGGQMPYTYAWDNGSTTSIASNLPAGPIGVTITDTDGCEIVNSVIISEPANLTSIVNILNDASCFGESDGSGEALAFGGTTPYTFLWENGETTSVATQLPGGINNVSITDNNGCFTTGSIAVNEPPGLTATVDNTTDANCTSCDGTADISVSGGTPPYTFLWSNGNTLEDPSDLCSGGNVVSVTDANGCLSIASAIVGNTSTLLIDNINIDAQVSCFGLSDGAATATVSGGQVPYTYIWTSGSTEPSATGLNAGNFGVTVTDADGCIAVNNIVITEPAAITLQANALSDATCFGFSDGAAEVLPIGGTAPYTYEWDNGETNATATNLFAGMHFVTVTDMNACFETASILITEPSSVASVFTSTPSSCFNNDGTATIIASGGTMPYTYVWDNGQTDATATGLSNGSQ